MARGRVLAIAGSDPSGGAGIQADLKTITGVGSYAMAAITALTVQNTLGVNAVMQIPPDFVRQQIDAVLSDIGADVIKIGMLGDSATIEAVAAALQPYASIPVVLDPVMVAKGGAPLLADDAVQTLRARLIPGAALVTPNAPEAERLTGAAVGDVEGQKAAGAALLALGAKAAYVKGGHIPGEYVRDVLVTPGGARVYEAKRIDTKATHGTGCTLASAIASDLAQGNSLEEAIARARFFLEEAILAAPGLGKGHQPLDHGWTLGLGHD
ncbi:MAG: bifunctional hydroxymethylpyrimidine kinase/phosphomethylpyrimidine kinase [Hyphomonadaceae bacterium]